MTKAAILIDGGYFLKRLPTVRPDIDTHDPAVVAEWIRRLFWTHLHQLNQVYGVWNGWGGAPYSGDFEYESNQFRLLYRCFYYDAPPYEGKAHTPIDKIPIDYSKTDQAIFRHELFRILRSQPNLALRLGEVRADRSRSWILKPQAQKDLLDNRRTVADLTDDDFVSALRQKGVDMRIGLDIASITLKRQAGVIVLVAGDADFVPAAKLARREGVQFILDPLWQSVSPGLSEHIDGLTNAFSKPRAEPKREKYFWSRPAAGVARPSTSGRTG